MRQSGRRGEARRAIFFLDLGGLERGKADNERRALSGLGFQQDFSPVIFHSAVQNRQAQARSLVGLLGREKRIEYPGQRFARDSLAGDLPPQNRSMLNERIFDILSVRLPNLGGFA